MNAFANSIVVAGMVCAGLVLTACAASPSAGTAMSDGNRGSAGKSQMEDDAVVDVQDVADGSGLAVVNDRGQRTVRCRKRRSTGSHIPRSTCSDRASVDSQPIREGLALPEVNVMRGTGGGRPGH